LRHLPSSYASSPADLPTLSERENRKARGLEGRSCVLCAQKHFSDLPSSPPPC
jgi:hypothetical protein